MGQSRVGGGSCNASVAVEGKGKCKGRGKGKAICKGKGKGKTDRSESKALDARDCPYGVCRYVWHSQKCSFGKESCDYRRCTQGEYAADLATPVKGKAKGKNGRSRSQSEGTKGKGKGKGKQQVTPCKYFANCECAKGKIVSMLTPNKK